MKYAMTIQNVIDLYNHRKVPKYRDRFDKAFTILYVILKVVVPRQFLPLHYHMLFELILSFCSKTCVFWPSISIRRHL
ncbi:Plasmid partition protein A [Klebsiella pneumoniae]|nr:Plasmid partition protein A [Klebsiella pneumoniae]